MKTRSSRADNSAGYTDLRPMNRTAAAILVCVLVALRGLAQTPSQQPPTFTTRVDLLTAEASVFDKDNRPIADLQAPDFTARVDGKPRSVVFARFYGSRGRAAREALLPSAAYVSNVGLDPARVIVIVVDQDSIRSGQEKAALDTASSLIDALRPGDAVGLLALHGVAANLSRDHAKVRETLARVIGTEPPRIWSRNITLDEARQIEEGDRRTRTEVMERECPLKGDTFCPADIINQSREMVQVATVRVQTTLNELTGLVGRLEAVRGPKHLVLISGGLPFDRELVGMYRDFGTSAAQARVAVYTIHLDQATNDASDRKYAQFGGRNLSHGLANLASISGGQFFHGVGQAAAPFARIEAEVNNYYELGIEGAPGDADGKTHAFEVKVARPGVRVAARSDIVAAPRSTAAGDEFLELLYQPIDVLDLPLAVATYAMRGDRPADASVLLSAYIGATTAVRGPVQWGFVVLADGKVVSSSRQSVSPAPGRPLVDTVSVTLAAGRYRLRVAALDAAGRGGVLEVPLNASLHDAGGLHASDLFVGTTTDGRFGPQPRVARGTALVAAAELYADDAAAFQAVDAQLELTSSAKTIATPMRFAEGSSVTVRPVQTQLSTSDLQPGRYVATMVVRAGGKVVGRVSRAIDLF